MAAHPVRSAGLAAGNIVGIGDVGGVDPVRETGEPCSQKENFELHSMSAARTDSGSLALVGDEVEGGEACVA